jgi:hypothetical protein
MMRTTFSPSRLLLSAVAAALLLVPTGCDTLPFDTSGGDDTANAPGFAVTGTVELAPVEGGCWVIESRGGETYLPRDLPDDFRVDGLPVRATLQEAGFASTCQIGTAVTITDIQRR